MAPCRLGEQGGHQSHMQRKYSGCHWVYSPKLGEQGGCAWLAAQLVRMICIDGNGNGTDGGATAGSDGHSLFADFHFPFCPSLSLGDLYVAQ